MNVRPLEWQPVLGIQLLSERDFGLHMRRSAVLERRRADALKLPKTLRFAKVLIYIKEAVSVSAIRLSKGGKLLSGT